MKTVLLFLTLLSTSGKLYSQGIDINDSSIFFTTDKIFVHYANTDQIADFSATILRFKDGRRGIAFYVKSISSKKPSIIRIDSIKLQLNENKFLPLTHPYRDTAFFTKQNELSQTIIYTLDDAEVETLKTELISKIIFPVNGIPFIVDLGRKRTIELSERAKLNL